MDKYPNLILKALKSYYEGNIVEALKSYFKAFEIRVEYDDYIYFIHVYMDFDLSEKCLEFIEKSYSYSSITYQSDFAKAVYYLKTNEFEEAITIFRAFVKKEIDDPSLLGLAHYYLANAICDYYTYNLEAFDNYQAAIKFYPEFTETYVNLGRWYEANDDLDNAIKITKQALLIEKNVRIANYNLGFFYENIGDNEKALEHYYQEMELDDPHPECFYNAALLHKEKKEYDKAIELNLKAYEITKTPFAYYNLGCVYALKNDYFNAKTYLLKAVDIDEDLINNLILDEELIEFRKSNEYATMLLKWGIKNA